MKLTEYSFFSVWWYYWYTSERKVQHWLTTTANKSIHPTVTMQTLPQNADRLLNELYHSTNTNFSKFTSLLCYRATTNRLRPTYFLPEKYGKYLCHAIIIIVGCSAYRLFCFVCCVNKNIFLCVKHLAGWLIASVQKTVLCVFFFQQCPYTTRRQQTTSYHLCWVCWHSNNPIKSTTNHKTPLWEVVTGVKVARRT